MRSVWVLLLAFFLSMAGWSGCSGYSGPASGETGGLTDYAVADSWLNLPFPNGDKAVDVFFLYPTCYFGKDPSCAVSDAGMRMEALKIREAHAGIFDSANFYAPFYRQLGLDYFQHLGNMKRVDSAIQAIPLADCRQAFEYYLSHFNKGRPIVFASHSQGTIVMRQLLLWIKETHPEVLRRTVAAYLIGFSITPGFIDQVGLPFARGRTDTGVIISYNTESPDATSNPFLAVLPGGMAINPISWERDDSYAGKGESLGSRIRFGDNAPVDRLHYADARVNPGRGTVVTNAGIKAEAPWPEGVLHRYDYDLFYYDLQKNVRDRIAAYLNK